MRKSSCCTAAQHVPQSGNKLTHTSGDSWSDIAFSLTGEQPGPDSPFGNSFPSYPEETAIFGAHWFMYLTTEFNKSYIETYCLARSSGTVNASITPHGTDDFVKVLQGDFLPIYGGPSESGWHSSSSLFAMFFGVNDINMVAEEWEDDIPMILDEIFATYISLVGQVSTMTFTNDNRAEGTSSFTRPALVTSYSLICHQ